MRAVRADTDESGLISQVQHQKCGQDCCQELNGVCKGAEEELSGCWAPLAGGRGVGVAGRKLLTKERAFHQLGQNKSCHSISVCSWVQQVIQWSTLFPEAVLRQPTAFGRVEQTISPLSAATHCLQVKGSVCTRERLWCAAEESLKMPHWATVSSSEDVTVHEAGWMHPVDRRYHGPSSNMQALCVAKLFLPGKLLKSLPWASPHNK